MDDYIKREDAINVFDWGMPDADVKCGIAIQNIKDIPSSDVVEVVRCKDCKYAEVADIEDSQDGYTCQFHRGSIWFSGDYCSWGDRADT